jgi:methanogenic corrinoid protein MtbC1
MNTKIPSQIYQDYLTALLSGDRTSCTIIVRDLQSSGLDIRDLFINLFQRSLYDLGELWEHHRISVAVEHLASSITERLMSMVEIDTFSAPHGDHSVIIACIADEYHQIGARMVSDIFELHGWNTHFLGANTPVKDLISMMHKRKPDLIVVSVSVYFNIPNLLSALTELRTSFPKIPILAGGQAFRWGGVQLLSRYENIRYICDIIELEQVIGAYDNKELTAS